MLEMVLKSCQEVTIEPPYLVRKYEVTEEEFDQLSNEDIKAELFDGVLIVHSPATLRHDRLCTFLSFLTCGYADTKKLGTVYGANNAVMRLAPGREFAPDLMFVGAERKHLAAGNKFEGEPDLVIEVLSESTRRYDLEEKRQAYHEAGIPEIWFADDQRRQLIVDRRQKMGYREQIIRRGKARSRVLPAFWLDASWLWQDELPDALACLKKILAA